MLYSKSSKELVELLTEQCSLNENTMAAVKADETSLAQLVESSIEAFREQYGKDYQAFGAVGEKLLKEDAEIAHQVMLNNLNDTLMNESVNVNYLTATMATTMRKPMEANIFRAFNSEAAANQFITIEQTFDTLTNGENTKVDAFRAFDDSTFLNTMVDFLSVGTAGIAPTRTAVDLLAGHNKSLHKLDKSARISTLEYFVGGTVRPASAIRFKKGTIPYFDSKNGIGEVIFEVNTVGGTWIDVKVDAKINFADGTLEYLNCDNPKGAGDTGVSKVMFDLSLSHDAHTSAITLGVRNKFSTLPIPTAPHFEVSESFETLHDLKNNESAFKGRDYVAMLSEKMVSYTALKEDLVLFNLLEAPANHMYEVNYDYEAPNTYAAGSPFEWIKLNLINLIDVACTQMKQEYHVKNAVFKILVSPMLLRIIDNGYNLNTDENIVSALNYSVVAKTAGNTMIFISSERYDAVGQINMILNDKDNPIIKTFEYWRYQSFLTDALQSSKNTARKAVVFTERNLPAVLEPVATKLKIDNLPHKKATGNRIVKVI